MQLRILVFTAILLALAYHPNASATYQNLEDISIGVAHLTHFPELVGENNLLIARAEKNTEGGANILLTTISKGTLTNISLYSVSQENLTEETFSPSICSTNKSVYVAWAEKNALGLAVLENSTVVRMLRLEGYEAHTPSLSKFENKFMLSFLYGKNSTSSILAVLEFYENGSYNFTTLDTFPFNAARKTACAYDIYGNAHIFLANSSFVEHYYYRTFWRHERLAFEGGLSAELNVKMLGNECYIGLKEASIEQENIILQIAEVLENGSVLAKATFFLSSHEASSQDIYFADRVYIAPYSQKTVYIAWSEQHGGEKVVRCCKIVGNEIVGIESLEGGKICGAFASLGKLYTLTIQEELLHCRIYKIMRESPNLTILESTPTTVTLSWSRCFDEDFLAYEIHYSTTPDFTPSAQTLYLQINDSLITSCRINLELGKTYYFLLVVRFNGEAIFSNQISYTTPKPVDAVNARVIDVERDSFTLSWDQIPCMGYQIHLAKDPGFSEEEVIELDNTTTTYTLSHLNASTTYFVFVRSLGFYGEYADTEPLPVLTKPELLEALANVDEIRICWSKPSALFFEKLEVYISSQEETLFNSSSLYTTVYNPDLTSLSIRFEEIGKKFYFGIVVYNTYHQAQKSNILSNSTHLPTLPKPRITRYEVINGTALKIYFDVPSSPYFSHLEIHLSTKNNFTPSAETLYRTIHTPAEQNCIIYGITPDVQYYVRIVLVDIFGQKMGSDEMRVCVSTSIETSQPEREIPFYLYALLLLIFFLSSIFAAFLVGRNK